MRGSGMQTGSRPELASPLRPRTTPLFLPPQAATQRVSFRGGGGAEAGAGLRVSHGKRVRVGLAAPPPRASSGSPEDKKGSAWVSSLHPPEPSFSRGAARASARLRPRAF